MDNAADRFLRGMAMANLLALAFHFYHPDLAPEEGEFGLSEPYLLISFFESVYKITSLRLSLIETRNCHVMFSISMLHN